MRVRSRAIQSVRMCASRERDHEDIRVALRCHSLVPWLVEHAAQLRNRFLMGPDGRTEMENPRGTHGDNWDNDFVQSIKRTPWSPHGEGRGDVRIHLTSSHPSFSERCASPETHSDNMVVQRNAQDVVQFWTGVGYPAMTLRDAMPGSNKGWKQKRQRNNEMPNTRSSPQGKVCHSLTNIRRTLKAPKRQAHNMPNKCG